MMPKSFRCKKIDKLKSPNLIPPFTTLLKKYEWLRQPFRPRLPRGNYEVRRISLKLKVLETKGKNGYLEKNFAQEALLELKFFVPGFPSATSLRSKGSTIRVSVQTL